jgi:hypothetical protein
MTTPHEYSCQQARCLYFDANGNRVQPAYDPWRALKELENHREAGQLIAEQRSVSERSTV